MTTCPKCSAAGWRISGPTYAKTERGSEVLRYRCMQCGYSEDRETHDAKDKPRATSHGE